MATLKNADFPQPIEKKNEWCKIYTIRLSRRAVFALESIVRHLEVNTPSAISMALIETAIGKGLMSNSGLQRKDKGEGDFEDHEHEA